VVVIGLIFLSLGMGEIWENIINEVLGGRVVMRG
jgi:hypothetical protein